VRGLVLAAAVVGALAPAEPARAHETLHDVERGKAIAVRAYFADGEVLAYTAYEVYSPADAKIPHQKGRTDRNGWLAFVPDVAGKWRVKVIDTTGHGLDLEIDATPPAGSAGPASGGAVASITFVLRPLLGIAAVGAAFAALFVYYRRKGTPP
jgi:nickel transport protein